MTLFGIEWVGLNADNAQRFIVSVAFVAGLLLVSFGLRWIIGLLLDRTDHATTQAKFWTRQGVSLLTALLLILGLLSIWFNDPTRLATVFGLMSAGVAFALQQVITSLAGYIVILRGSTFTVGDRISMGGVRGDVIRLGFIQTTIMEMGQPPTDKTSNITLWVMSRQFTGRTVTVANSKIFAEPVYNYSREFPYLWEEMAIPVTYRVDEAAAERIILEAARKFAVGTSSLTEEAVRDLKESYGVTAEDFEPRVYMRITDQWLEMALRFVVRNHGAREVKDAMTREILTGFRSAGITIASPSVDISRR